MENNQKPKARKRVAVLTETTHAAGRNMIKGIARYVREHETWSVYYAPRALEQNAPSWLKNWDGDGIIARISSETVMEKLRQSPIPVVDLIGGTNADKSHPNVLVSDEGIGRKAATYFLDHGFQHFAFLGMKNEYWSTCRQVGFYGVLNEGDYSVQSLKLPSFYSARRKTSWEQTEAVLEDWVRTLPQPCAVLCANDDLGPYLTEACRRAGILIPDEIAVLGVDNDTLFCELCDPPLSSIDANHTEAGYQAAATLDRLMQGKKAEAAIRFVPSREIVERTSTDIIATNDDALKKAVRFIQENCGGDINVDDVAAHAALSRSVLQRRFKTFFGQTVNDRIIQERVRAAQNLLAHTNLPIIDIAERTGFGQQVYMGAVFRRRLNQTPKQYREQNRQ